MIVVRAKTAAINLEMNPPEMRKARIERAKWSLMQKIMKDYPADRYEEVLFWVVPPPLEKTYELAQQHKREDGEWYFRGERVPSEVVMNYVTENYVIVDVAARVWESNDAYPEAEVMAFPALKEMNERGVQHGQGTRKTKDNDG
jgi:hypothetical protein